LKRIFLMAALACLARPGRAAALNAASLSDPFEKTLESARSAGMGGSLLYADDDISTLLENPAVLGELATGQVALNHNSWIADIVQETVSLGVPLDALGFGAEANYVSYGTFQGLDDNGNPTTAIGASDLGFGLGIGGKIGPGLAGGIMVKTTQQTLDDKAYTTYSMDAGAVAHPLDSLDASAAYDGMGSSIGGSQRATVLRLGADWRAHESRDWAAVLGLAFNLAPQASNEILGGGELQVAGRYYFRLGYAQSVQDNQVAGLNNVTFGVGLWLKPLRIDYAYLPFGDLGNVQRISFDYAFGAAKAEAAPAPAATPTPAPLLTPQPTALPTVAPQPDQGADHSLEFVIKVPAQELAGARDLAAKGLYKEAVAAYNQILAEDPQNAAAWRELGDLYFKLGRKSFALSCFDEALKLHPDAALQSWVEKYRSKME
jgi:tetratricopeptide (TPR) repeat protein